jgi:2-C-methyl-D-erythritol 4-phosphate cytidylyltransferase/2-C-methyl-D-erythritol 2,4-cyclodiphosphate synthase
VVAGGRSDRFGPGPPKQYRDLGGRTLLEHAVDAVGGVPGVDAVVVVLPEADVDAPVGRAILRRSRVAAVVAGGETRARSVERGLLAAPTATFVLVHDAARPLVPSSVVVRVLEATRRHGAAVPAVPVVDTVKWVSEDGERVRATLDRGRLRAVQTPQGARADILLEALREAREDGVEVTDEAAALERVGVPVAVVEGDPDHGKITTPGDLRAARREIGGDGMNLRIGQGVDLHRFADDDRPLVLGGVRFPGERGLEGHSDADVVLHAAMDAVLGAAGLPDIGARFPPEDPAWAGASSVDLAARVREAVAGAGFGIVNLDLALLAERPRIRERVEEMRRAIAAAFGIAAEQVGLKATTLEGMGELGRGAGAACTAVALLTKRDDDDAR